MTTIDEPLVHPGLTAASVNDAAPAPSGAAGHLRDILAGELRKATRKLPLLEVDLRSRPGWQVVYDPNLNVDLAKGWAKGIDIAEDGQFDIALRCLATQCRGFVLNGNPVVLDGERLTFASKFIQDELGAIDAVSAVRALYDDDTAVTSHYARLAEASGDGLDPTTGSTGS